MKTNKKRSILSVLISLIMLIGMFSTLLVPAQAEEPIPGEPTTTAESAQQNDNSDQAIPEALKYTTNIDPSVVNTEDALKATAKYEMGKTDNGIMIFGSANPNFNPRSRSTGNGGDRVSKNYSGSPSFTQIITVTDGSTTSIAYCIDPSADVPAGANYSETDTTAAILKVLYYGYGGPGSAEFMNREGNNINDAYMDTWMAVRYFTEGNRYGYDNDNNVRFLVDHANAPSGSFNVGNTPQNANWNTSEKRQETDWYSTSGSGNYTVEVNGTGIGVMFEGNNTVHWGNVSASIGTRFKLIADHNKNGYSEINLSTDATSASAKKFEPDEPRWQRLVALWGSGSVPSQKVGVTFTKRVGKIEVTKEGLTHDGRVIGNLAGAVYEIYDASNNLVQTLTTPSSGVVTSTDLIFGNYTIKEKTAPHGYVLNVTPQGVTIDAPDEIERVKFQNTEQLANLYIKKIDAETTDGSPQGDAVLSGAKYEVTRIKDKDGNTVSNQTANDVHRVITTDAQGKATVGSLKLGTYSIKETVASEGYLLNPQVYEGVLAYGDQTVSINTNTPENKVKETVKKGRFLLLKYLKDNPYNSDVPVEFQGVTFTIKHVATNKVVDTVVTNTKGQGISVSARPGDPEGTIPLPYGEYIAIESIPSTVAGHKVEDVRFKIDADGDTEHNYKPWIKTQTNVAYYQRATIIKKDSETGRSILKAGAVFKIWSVENNAYIKMPHSFLPIEIDEFLTDRDGIVRLTHELKYGHYELHEQLAPEGYIRDPKPLPFEVKQDSTKPKDEPPVYEVNMNNSPAKGKITVEKTGEMLTRTTTKDTEFGPEYQFAYEQKALKDANFNIVAAEDIVTGDGTVHARTGDVVARLTSDNNGTSTTPELYLGKYIVKETSAPDGYVLDTKEYPIELKYKDQDTKIVIETQTVLNTRQTIKYDLLKDRESFVRWENGQAVTEIVNGEGIVFGLFAKADIRNWEGTVVCPKDALISVMTVDADGHAISKADLPAGKVYAKELKTKPELVLNTEAFEQEYNPTGNTPTLTYHLNNNNRINNMLLRGDLEVVKVDSTTTRPISGATIVLMDANKKVIDTKITDAQGKVKFENLIYGKYFYEETIAPEGYFQNTEVKEFFLDQPNQIIQGQFENKPVKGYINIHKTGEMLDSAKTSATKYGDVYSFLYSQQNLKDVYYGVYAKTDIVTKDGTVRAKAGDKVGYVGTDDKGNTVSPELFLGDYFVKEEKAPAGYVLNTNAVNTSLKYEGQTAEFVYSAVGEKNARQQTSFSIKKNEEVVTKFENGKIVTERVSGDNITFGLFTDRDITNYAGKVICKKDSLVDVLTTDQNGQAISKYDLPSSSYYAKELETKPQLILNTDKYGGQNPAKDNIPYYNVALNNGAEINNDLSKGSIKILKRDGGTKLPIADAVVNVIRLNNDLNMDGFFTNDDITMFQFKIEHDHVLAVNNPQMDLDQNGVVDHTDLALFSTAVNNNDLNVLETVVATGKTDTKGEYRIDPLPYGSYRMQEVTAPDGYLLNDESQSFTMNFNGQVIEKIVENMPVKGKINISKTGEMLADSHTEASDYGDVFRFDYTQQFLVGVHFDVVAKTDIVTKDGTIRAKAGEIVDQLVTDANGAATTKELYLGAYDLKETAAPDGFQLNTEIQTAHLVYKDQLTPIVFDAKSFEDLRQDIVFHLSKTRENFTDWDQEHGKANTVQNPAKGITFGVYVTEDIKNTSGRIVVPNGSLLDVLVTDENGKAQTSGGYPQCSILAREISTHVDLVPNTSTFPHNYAPIGNEPTIHKDFNNNQAIENKFITSKVVINKTDVTTAKALPGATIQIHDSKGALVYEGISDANGDITLEKLIYGDYSFTEIYAPDGYLVNKEVIPFEVKVDGTIVKASMTDEPVKGIIDIKKTGDTLTDSSTEKSEFGDLFSFKYEEKPLLNCVFEVIAKEDIVTKDGTVRAKAGEVVDTITTDENGLAKSKELFLGTYILHEIEAPVGYILAEDQEVTLKYADQDTPIVYESASFNNRRQEAIFNLQKTEEVLIKWENAKRITEQKPADGIVFGLYNKEDITNNEGEVICKKDNLISLLVTDKDGKASSKKDIPMGTVYAKELKTKDHLRLDNIKVYEAIYKPDNNETLIDIFLNDKKVIENYLKEGTWEITKKDVNSTETLLPGTKITLYDQDKKVIFEGTTDSNGFISFGKLPIGKYFYQETGAPDGYELDNTLFPFEIKEDLQIVKCVMTNKPIPKAPETGNNTNNMGTLVVAAVLIVLAGVGVTLVIRKRKQKIKGIKTIIRKKND